jgi:hypothetical protein
MKMKLEDLSPIIFETKLPNESRFKFIQIKMTELKKQSLNDEIETS